jgi:hypothetical protein
MLTRTQIASVKKLWSEFPELTPEELADHVGENVDVSEVRRALETLPAFLARNVARVSAGSVAEMAAAGGSALLGDAAQLAIKTKLLEIALDVDKARGSHINQLKSLELLYKGMQEERRIEAENAMPQSQVTINNNISLADELSEFNKRINAKLNGPSRPDRFQVTHDAVVITEEAKPAVIAEKAQLDLAL